MTKYELIKAHTDFFNILANNSIEPKEVQYLTMVEEYKSMKAKKHKISYIVSFLGEKHGLSERSVYKIVKRFSQRIKI